ncbi:DUF1561 family protein [Bartonella sp. F02]|uniref:DUF1561 family protein n=1 Tax=Bartonella sp. F02 TaxID=2967262 RepID=UPI0022A9AB1B|nr:DUF1561 family protein [Bartonella sp. F02]MCZ2328993.1 DUF1561 domain-containing protein [Bartonella sp. F02]
MQISVLFAAPDQKISDPPIDKAIHIKAHTGYEYCYAPAFVDGESYVYIDNCSSSGVKFARYDVFQRIAWKIDDVWLCMTAPGSVTGVDGDGQQQWDYLKLRPCVINDPNQRWVINGRALYTADEKYRVKDYKWYTYISKNQGDYYDHTLSAEMDHWINTVAAPGNMSLKTFVGWSYVSRDGFTMYYLSDNGSKTEITDLYYNPENGHLARYFPSSGILSCMASKQSPQDNWDWVEWRFCKDIVSKQRDAGYWDISFLNGREGPARDKNGNYLRVTQFGTNWGVPYTAKGSYIKGDTTNSPKSNFVFSYDIQRWEHFVSGNFAESLHYCPAPGKQQSASHAKVRVKRSLPPDFKLNDAWRKRLHAIATSTASTTISAGICGTCLLHTYQIIAELQSTYPRDPLTEGGYFFDTAQGVDPMISLNRRFHSVYSVMRNAPQFYGIPLHPTESSDAIAVRIAASTTQSVLPQFEWRTSSLATTHDDILKAIRELLTAPAGTVWIGLMTYEGGTGRHAVPILRTSAGLKVIPTNTSLSYFEFTNETSETMDPNLVLLRLSQRRGVSAVTSFASLQLMSPEQAPLSVVLSQNNCTGEGEDRRGSGRLPASYLVNQCASGRCPL